MSPLAPARRGKLNKRLETDLTSPWRYPPSGSILARLNAYLEKDAPAGPATMWEFVHENARDLADREADKLGLPAGPHSAGVEHLLASRADTIRLLALSKMADEAKAPPRGPALSALPATFAYAYFTLVHQYHRGRPVDEVYDEVARDLGPGIGRADVHWLVVFFVRRLERLKRDSPSDYAWLAATIHAAREKVDHVKMQVGRFVLRDWSDWRDDIGRVPP